MLRPIDDYVAFAGMQANPGQDTVRLVPASGVLFLVIDSADVCGAHLEVIKALPNLCFAMFPSSCCFGRQDRQKKEPERETDSEDGVQCEIFPERIKSRSRYRPSSSHLATWPPLVPSAQSGRSFNPGEFTAKGVEPIN
jgi:hypothetical protein